MSIVSTDERREVARRLRGAKYGWHSWERALYDALGVDTETAGLDMLDSLADLIEPSCDRDALLKLADTITEARNALPYKTVHWTDVVTINRSMLDDIACRIREACGVVA